MRKMIILIVAILALPLAACSGLMSQASVPAHFLLHPAPAAQESDMKRLLTIVVAEPEVVAGLDTDRIALLKNERRELDYFADARWNGRLDEIMQDFIVETFENRYGGVVVDNGTTPQKADYKIFTKIRDFQAEYDGVADAPPILRVSMVLSTVKLPKETVSSQIKIEKTAPATANTLTAITSGLELLLQQSLEEAVQQLGDL